MSTLDLNDTEAVVAFAHELTILTRRHDNARHAAAGMPFFEPHVAWCQAALDLGIFVYAYDMDFEDPLPAAETALVDLAIRAVTAGDFPGWGNIEGMGELLLDHEDVTDGLERADIGRPGAFDREDAWVIEDTTYAILFEDLPGDEPEPVVLAVMDEAAGIPESVPA